MEQVYCQSCGMPMNAPQAKYGTEADGEMSKDYCCYCYENGGFIKPDETMEEMIESCVPFVVEANPSLSNDEARKQMNVFFPSLKRWREVQ